MTSLAEDLKDIRHRVLKIKDTFKNVGTIEAEDLEFLCDRAVGFVALTHIAENDWITLKTLQVTSKLEINDLVRQVDSRKDLG